MARASIILRFHSENCLKSRGELEETPVQKIVQMVLQKLFFNEILTKRYGDFLILKGVRKEMKER